jgi:hypothetical protein
VIEGKIGIPFPPGVGVAVVLGGATDDRSGTVQEHRLAIRVVGVPLEDRCGVIGERDDTEVLVRH